MSNVILTPDMITKMAVSLFKNSNMFIQNINTQYDKMFAIDGAKIGDTVRIRLPNDYTVSHGPAFSAQDTAEKFTSLALVNQSHVDVSFSTAERTLKMDDYAERVLLPMTNNLAGDIAADIMTGADTGICNYVSNTDGSGNVISPTQTTVLRAKALLEQNSTPQTPRRKLVQSPVTEANLVGTLAGLFNPTPAISEQYQSGEMKSALGFDFYMDQTVINHTTGTFSAGGAVSSAGQSGSTIAISAITGTINAGDLVTIDGVNSVNRVTKKTNAKLRQFVVTAAVPSGGTSISVYPAIIPSAGGNAVQYQTVDVSPANGAQVRLVNLPGETYSKNFAYSREAVTMATADLIMPKGVHEASRSTYSGISMRMVTAYQLGTDQLGTRYDVIYGYKFVRPEWGVIIADVP